MNAYATRKRGTAAIAEKRAKKRDDFARAYSIVHQSFPKTAKSLNFTPPSNSDGEDDEPAPAQAGQEDDAETSTEIGQAIQVVLGL